MIESFLNFVWTAQYVSGFLSGIIAFLLLAWLRVKPLKPIARWVIYGRKGPG